MGPVRIGIEDCGPRRLPVYFILDCSSVPHNGFAVAAAQQVLAVVSRLNAWAIQSREEYQSAPVFYTVIVFRRQALQLQPLASPQTYRFDDLRLGDIEPYGERGFAAALAALQGSIEYELKMPGADNGDEWPLVFLFTDELPTLKLKAPTAKLFVCGIESPPKTPPSFAGLVPEFLPLESQAQIFDKIEAARVELKKGRQQMIDYPTVY
jgi:uncharacterized protein YegL